MSPLVRNDHPLIAALEGMPYRVDPLLSAGAAYILSLPGYSPVVLMAPDVMNGFSNLAFLNRHFPSWANMAKLPNLLGDIGS